MGKQMEKNGRVPCWSQKSCDHRSFEEGETGRVSSSLLSLQFCLIIPPQNWSKLTLNWNGAPLSDSENSVAPINQSLHHGLLLLWIITNLSKKTAHKFHIRLLMSILLLFLSFFMDTNSYLQKCEVGFPLSGGVKLGEEPGLTGWYPLLLLLWQNLSSERAAPQEKELLESIHPWKNTDIKDFWSVVHLSV